MSFFRNVDIELDFLKYNQEIQQRQEQSLLNPTEQRVGVRTTLFSVGKDPRVSTEPNISAPDLKLIEILLDGLKNPYTEIHWRILRSDVERAGVLGFNVFRRKIPRKKFLKESRRSDEPARNFSTMAFSRVSRNIPLYGRFAPQSKALNQINREIIDPVNINAGLSELTQVALSRFGSSLDSSLPILNGSKFDQPSNDLKYKKIGYVGYNSFLAKENKKFVKVVERDFVDLSFKDKSVVFGEAYEYYVTSVPADIRESVQSNSVKVMIEDQTPIRPPSQVFAKIIDGGTKIKVSVVCKPDDHIDKILVYKKGEDEVAFVKVASIANKSDCINFEDSLILYGKEYTYRVFGVNIHGVLSDPKEITLNAFSQNVLSRGRSNNLKIPILNVIQDQNSNNLKISISSNDPRVSYYELDRKDLTIHQRSFSAPGQGTTGLGSVGWKTNKFFVDRQRKLLDKAIVQNKDVLKRTVSQVEIEFVDEFVQKDHIYEYRVRGIDLFGNVSSFAFQRVKAIGKQPVRTPINFRLDVLRQYPFRIKLSWADDNESTRFTKQELFQVESTTNPDPVKFIYQIQRRKAQQKIYETFPSTANSFLVDEVSAEDNIPLLQKKVEDTFSVLESISKQSVVRADPNTSLTSVISTAQSANTSVDFANKVVRPFQTPAYLEINEVYFYRVATIRVIDGKEEISNYTPEFRVRTVADLANPLSFKATAINLRVSPLVAVLTWQTGDTFTRPDYWEIERKVDVETDTFEVIGRSYIEEKFFDKNLQRGSSYIYRIRSFDGIGRESDYFEARLTL